MLRSKKVNKVLLSVDLDLICISAISSHFSALEFYTCCSTWHQMWTTGQNETVQKQLEQNNQLWVFFRVASKTLWNR